MCFVVVRIAAAGLCQQDAGFDAASAVPATQLSDRLGGAGERTAASECGRMFALQLHEAACTIALPSQRGHAGGEAGVPVPQSKHSRLPRGLTTSK